MTIKRILIVEDEHTLRGLMVEILEGEGYTCFEASHGLEATKILDIAPIDLLITDFRMPYMTGVELISWCREKRLHFPVIFITANVDLLPAETMALSDCCAALLNKPVGMFDLLSAITNAEARDHTLHCT